MALKKSRKLTIKKSTGALIKPEETSTIDTYVVTIDRNDERQICTATLTKNGVTTTIDWPFGSGEIQQIQSDWTQTDTTKADYIKNKPDLTTYATLVALTNEANTRSANDLSLSQNLDKEVEARKSADSTLQSNIDTLGTSKQDTLSSKNAGTNVTITNESGVVKINATGSLTTVNWGGITGTLSNQQDLQQALNKLDAKIGEDENGIYVELGE